MQPRQFLSAILPEEGPYFISSKNRRWSDVSVDTIDEAVAKIEQYKQLGNRDIYVATGSYLPGSGRVQSAVRHKKVFYVDMDCAGPNRQYDSKEDALNKLREVCRARKIAPPTLVVDSGRGLHAYWIMRTLIPENIWTVIAKAFKAALQDAGLDSDPAVTADSTRVMRVPTTINMKNQQECKLLIETGKQYTPREFAELMSLGKYSKGKSDPALGNVVPMRPDLYDRTKSLLGTSGPRYFSAILDKCALARRERETGGAGASYPLWFGMLNLLAFCEDGDQWAHPVSALHADYSIDDTERRYIAAVSDKESGKLRGATTCETFHGCAPEVCSQCPHWKDPARGQSWSSPIHFGVNSAPYSLTALPQNAVQELPFPYIHMTGGTGLREEVYDDKGNKSYVVNRVMRFALANPEILGKEPEIYFACDMDLYGIVKRVNIATCNLSRNDKALYSQLSTQGVLLREGELTHFKRILVDWYQKVEAMKGRSPLIKQYGWVPGNPPRFAVGDDMYEKGSPPKVSRMVEEGFGDALKPAGSEDEWRRLSKAALQAGHIETEVLFASAFAAPLVSFTSVAGCILSAVSPKSGTGKSLALRLGQSVWGNPTEGINSMNDTPNSLVKRMSLSNSLPAYWDEVRIHDKESLKFVDFLYRCTQGREKSRMNAKAELQATPSWKTMMVCASNCGLQEHIQNLDKHTNAGMMRVLEFQVSPLDETKMADGHQFWALDRNYGHVGRKYAQYLVDNMEKVEKVVMQTVAALTKQLNASADERFYLSTIATLLVGATIARNQGWVDFDVERIKSFLLGLYKAQVQSVREESEAHGSRNTITVVQRFLDAHAESTLVTDLHTPTNRKGVCRILVTPKRDPVLVRYGVNDDTLLIDIATWRKWAFDNVGDAKTHTAELQKHGAHIKVHRMLSGIRPLIGINVSKRCLVITRNAATDALFESVDAITPAGETG